MRGQKQPKIFIVEDDRNNHPLFEKAFGDAGFLVTIRRTADGDFIDDIVKANPDIISMDIMIGKSGADVERDGLEAGRLLKADERTADIPIMILTNFFVQEKVEQAKAFGAVDFINLQGHSIAKIPEIFKRYLDNPRGFTPTHPLLRI